MTLRIVFVILAILCGIALVIQLDTGSLNATQVAGLGIIFAASATVAP
jgi:hypothetical protein